MGNLRARKVLRIVITIFVSFHFIAVALWNFPSYTTFGDLFRRPLYSYMFATGQWQIWKMFTNKAHYSRYHVSIKAHFGTEERPYGSMLPGLKPYRPSFRIHLFFLNSSYKDQRRSLIAYAQRVCRAVSEKERRKPEAVSLVYDTDRIRDIYKIRQDGVISTPRVWEKRFPCA